MLRKLVENFKRRARLIARFRAAQHGATAVEFAIIAPPFLATLIAIFEVILYLFAQQTLQSAAVEAGRYFMTGQGQNSSMSQTTLINDICPLIQAVLDCNKIMVDMQVYSSFSGATTSAPTLTYDASGNVTNAWQFNPGSQGQVMVVRLIYQWPIVSAPLGFMLPNNGNGTTEIMGVSAFRVEPY
jgi:Flp pilus assembly protein TadG